MSGIIEWIIFLPLALIAIVTAAGMIITMSMYRAGLTLMASFVALAGLFILLDADLLAAIQVMMNVGGMLVMVLFMVMMMIDPGGEMMWGMKRGMHMRGLGAFSMHMPSGPPPPEDEQEIDTSTHDMGGMDMDGMGGMDMGSMNTGDRAPRQNYDMLAHMAMSTAQLPWAIVLGVISAALLIILLILTPWPTTTVVPTQDASRVVGELLLSRYMISFEGAALLILAGIAGAVLLAKREHAPNKQPRTQHPQKNDGDTAMYICSMHAKVRQQGPGTCPTCGMALIPAQETGVTKSQRGEQL